MSSTVDATRSPQQATPPPAGTLDADERLLAATRLFRPHGLQPQLDAIVAEAARETGFSIAAISIVLRRTQRFMAAHGLPPDLEASRATDRCVSFCQTVVREERTLEVPDVADRADLPPELISLYGLRAYLGTPIKADGQIVGTLCLLDVEPRAIDAKVRTTLQACARRVELLFGVLTDETRRVRELTRSAAQPAFAELRNVLCRISVASELVETALTDLVGSSALLAAVARGELPSEQLARNAAVLGSTEQSSTEALALMRDIARDFETTTDLLDALQGVVSPNGSSTAWVHQLLSAALTTATHETRAAGGVLVEPFSADLAVQAELAESASALASVLVALAQAAGSAPQARLRLRIVAEGDHVDFIVSVPPMDAATTATVQQRLARLLDTAPSTRVACARDGVTLRFPATPIES